MASWKRFFTTPNPQLAPTNSQNVSNSTYSNFSSGLKETFTGPSSRIERYNQLDILDRDPVIYQALNILAEFSTQENKFTNLPFNIQYMAESNETEVEILKQTNQKWCYINNFRTRLFFIFRNIFKYGDAFFIRDPETYEWFYVDPRNVEKIVVDETEGKQIHSYFIRNISLNLLNKVFTHDTKNANTNSTYAGIFATNNQQSTATNTTQATGTGQSYEILAEHVVHLSMNSAGLDYVNWPFGASILESVYKPAKQKEMLENAYLIYRVQRAPERRAFYIYTGDMPSHKAMQFVERVKNEFQQKRIPSRSGGTNSVVDGTYDPQCIALDTMIPLLDGRIIDLQSIIEEFNSGKNNWVYSCDPKTGKIVPGPITWAGVTRKNTQVLKLTLDNGKELVMTPDHKIPVWGKGYVEAQDIIIGEDSIISFNTKEQKNWMEFKRNQNEFNHKVISIEWMEEKIDTGCITVDGNNEYHGFHNFAVANGIFLKNSLLEDYYFPVNADGQGPRVEQLSGGDGLSSGVDDLLYFNNAIIRGLGIPASYIATTGEDSNVPYNDGKVGVAFLQEWRFSQHCTRLQNLMRDVFDREFKLFCKKRGVEINAGDFHIEFEEPQSFSEYRQMEKDQSMFSILSQADSMPYLAKRFILKRFGMFTEDEINENESLWKVENKGKIKDTVADLEINDFQELSLNTVGIKKKLEDTEEEQEDLNSEQPLEGPENEGI